MFTHLRLHTEFSVVDGTNRIDDVVAAAAADAQPALAITDLSNLFGAVKFYKAARGVQASSPSSAPRSCCKASPKRPPAPCPAAHQPAAPRVLLLVQDMQGYLNLSELLARAWTRNAGRGQARGAARLAAGVQRGADPDLGCAGWPGGAGALAGRCPARRRHCPAALERCSRTASTSSCSARAAQTTNATWRRPCSSRPGSTCRWWPRTRCSFSTPTATRPMKPACALPKAKFWATTAACAASRASSTSRAPRKCRRCLPTYRPRWPTRWRLRKRCNLTLTLGKPQLPNFPTPLIDGVPMPMSDFFRQSSFRRP